MQLVPRCYLIVYRVLIISVIEIVMLIYERKLFICWNIEIEIMWRQLIGLFEFNCIGIRMLP